MKVLPGVPAIAALGCALVACAGGGNQQTAAGHRDLVDVAPATGQLGLPALGELRASAGLTETMLYGSSAVMTSAGAVDNGTAINLAAGDGAAEWALYRFNNGQPLDSLAVLLDSPSSSAYICLANYSDSRWEISGPFGAAKTIAVDGGAYKSPDGDLWCAVVASGGEAMVSALSVRTLNPLNAEPTADLEADVLSGDAPLLVQFDGGGSADSDGMIIEYAWDWEGDGGYDTITDNPLFSHTFTEPGIFLGGAARDRRAVRARQRQPAGQRLGGRERLACRRHSGEPDGRRGAAHGGLRRCGQY